MHQQDYSPSDHPREYGENPFRGYDGYFRWGSSPRIRGEYAADKLISRDGGIIPANTGRICGRYSATIALTDHPREYGENLNRHVTEMTKGGSSPRIRGEFIFDNGPCFLTRIIPANTGRMSVTSYSLESSRDHPREYGENPRKWPICPWNTGSSPRIRGESELVEEPEPVPGIIPANTGRILDALSREYPDRDHPREYGENTSTPPTRTTSLGSSPRIRGECGGLRVHEIGHGIIPANTGRISLRRCNLGPKRDHPREYGENTEPQCATHINHGSSPRIRGE